jgi:hypothetical protein
MHAKVIIISPTIVVTMKVPNSAVAIAIVMPPSLPEGMKLNRDYSPYRYGETEAWSNHGVPDSRGPVGEWVSGEHVSGYEWGNAEIGPAESVVLTVLYCTVRTVPELVTYEWSWLMAHGILHVGTGTGIGSTINLLLACVGTPKLSRLRFCVTLLLIRVLSRVILS